MPRINGKFEPKLATHKKRADWRATLDVETEDVPRLMREGFHWTADNVRIEENSMNDYISDMLDLSRSYFLTDMSSGRKPQWTAWLEVTFRQQESRFDQASRFRVSDLSPDQVYRAEAWNWRGELVYTYSAFPPVKSINSIYDDMPLGGWWPWPKAAATAAEEPDREDEGENGSQQLNPGKTTEEERPTREMEGGIWKRLWG